MTTETGSESPSGTPASGARSESAGEHSWRIRRALAIALASTLGLLLGIGAFTFSYAEGFSYFKTDPTACVNCHIMRSQFDSWQKSSHHAVAVCVDCHLPDAFVPKYIAKAENGYRHGKEFTAGTFDEPIFVKQRGREILEDNCVRCHEVLVAEMNVRSREGPRAISCVRCHAGVGHGEPARLGGRLLAHEMGGRKRQ